MTDPLMQEGPPQVPSRGSGRGSPVFIGPNGIRAGWRLLIFIAILVGLVFATQFGLSRIPAVRGQQAAQNPQVMTPVGQVSDGILNVLCLFIAAFVMTKIEKRSFADYGLPAKGAFGKYFWEGIPFGLAMVTLLMVLIAALHGFSIDGFAIHGEEAAKAGVLYGIGFILVGILEEFLFRGYIQSTLASAMGFWPAAILISIVFGGIHLQNPGEAWVGALMAGIFGMVAALSLQRTGTIWFGIGMHAAFDWGETYLYSVPDSGFLAQGHLLNSTFHGDRWLTGGSVGPEGSAMAFVTLALAAAGIHFVFPDKKLRA